MNNLEEICSRINSEGFYLGLGGFLMSSNCQIIIGRMTDKFHVQIPKTKQIIDPNNQQFILAMIDARNAFKAYEVHGVEDMRRFFNFNINDLGLVGVEANGIVLVSHKLKLMAYAYVVEKDHRKSSLLFKEYNEYGDVFHITNLDVRPNSLHAGYTNLNDIGVNIFNICFSKEEMFEDILLVEKKLTENTMNRLKKKIERCKQEIIDCEKGIDDENKHIQKYEIDLYASRVNSDLID